MIIIVKLITGEEVIGEIENNQLTYEEYYNIINPMVVTNARDDQGYVGMRLRDFLILSKDDVLTLPSKHVIAAYRPSDAMTEYYIKASYYSINYTKPLIDDQIKNATYEMDRSIEEEKAAMKEYTERLMKAAGSTLQ